MNSSEEISPYHIKFGDTNVGDLTEVYGAALTWYKQRKSQHNKRAAGIEEKDTVITVLLSEGKLTDIIDDVRKGVQDGEIIISPEGGPCGLQLEDGISAIKKHAEKIRYISANFSQDQIQAITSNRHGMYAISRERVSLEHLIILKDLPAQYIAVIIDGIPDNYSPEALKQRTSQVPMAYAIAMNCDFLSFSDEKIAALLSLSEKQIRALGKEIGHYALNASKLRALKNWKVKEILRAKHDLAGNSPISGISAIELIAKTTSLKVPAASKR